ncbi:MAG: hypothetical protein H0U76_28655 [Ktedonobacteraceae bacterium]|nr:hypothetical protein [Ktedonobacteraceae bacterium]
MRILQRKVIGKTEGSEQSLWTVETLHEHLLTLITANEIKYSERFDASQNAIHAAFAAQKLAVDTALSAADRAVTKAETAAEKRFESVNEFRQTLTDQAGTFIPRGEAAAVFKSYDDKLEAMRVSFEKSNDALSKEISNLRESRSEVNGKASGANAVWGYLVAIAGIVLALIFHFVK